MALLYNGKSPIRIKYNDKEVRKVNYGETTVWRLIPEEYTEVEWLQSDGACYVDINRVPNMDDIIEQKFMSLNTTSSVCSWYGSMPASNAVRPRFSMGISNTGFFVGANNTNACGPLDNEIHIIKWQQITDSTVSIDLDGGGVNKSGCWRL